MSSTQQLLTKVLAGPTFFMDAKQKGISERTFYTDEEKTVWGLIDVHFQKHANVPVFDYILKLVPTFVAMPVENRTISEIVEQIHKERVEIEIRKSMAEIDALLAREKYMDAIGLMHKGASAASQGWGLSRDTSLTKNAESVLFTYFDIKENGIMRGIPWPWDPLNQATGGILPATYTVLYGRMKSTKTFRLLQIASLARQRGKNVLVVTCEMSDSVLLQRLVCIELALDYDKFTKGMLSAADEELMQEHIVTLMEASQGQNVHITQLADSPEGKTVSALRAKIDEYTPDLILVDSMYKMHDEQTGKRDAKPDTVRNISYDLQQLAQMSKIPVAVTTQANRAGIKAKVGNTGDVAFSDAFAMDCDLLLRLDNDEETGRTVFLVNAAREAKLDGFSTGNKLCHGLGPIVRPDGTPDWSFPKQYRNQPEATAGDSPMSRFQQ